MEAAARARRARAVEEVQHLSALADESDDTPAEHLSTVAGSDGTPAEQECDHFSIRGYVSMMDKRDPKLCSAHIFYNQTQFEENHSSPVLVSKHRRWDCSKCLGKVKVPCHSQSMEHDGLNDDFSISIVQIRRLFPSKQQSSDRLPLSKAAQEGNSNNNSPSNNVITANVPVVEENVPDAVVERSVPATQDLQDSTNNVDFSANNSNNAASKDVSDIPNDVGSGGMKKSNKSTEPDISNLQICQGKQQKKRLLSEQMCSNQVGVSADEVQADNANSDFPMDVVELHARNQHERHMCNTVSLENCHTQPKVAQGGINASNGFNTNFPKSLVSEGQQKSLQDHASSSIEAANINPQDLQTHKSSQCHGASSASTEIRNGHPLEPQMENSPQVYDLPITEIPLTLHDISRRKLQPNMQRPVRPHPRVGVLGSLLPQDIAKWSANYGPQSGCRFGDDSKGTTSLDLNRNGNYEAFNSGMLSAGWSALQLGSVTSVANPECQLQRNGTGKSSTSGNGKDICVTNRNPADFTVISDKNGYMRNI